MLGDKCLNLKHIKISEVDFTEEFTLKVIFSLVNELKISENPLYKDYLFVYKRNKNQDWLVAVSTASSNSLTENSLCRVNILL